MIMSQADLERRINVDLSLSFPQISTINGKNDESLQFWKSVPCQFLTIKDLEQLKTIETPKRYKQILEIINTHIQVVEHNQIQRQKYEQLLMNDITKLLLNKQNTKTQQYNNIQITSLEQLTKQASIGINSKKQLMNFIKLNKNQLFNKKYSIQNSDLVWIMNNDIESYEMVTELNDQEYLEIQMKLMEKLLIYKQLLRRYLQGGNDREEFVNLINNDGIFGHNNNYANQLIRYVLNLAHKNSKRIYKTEQITNIMRKQLLFSIKRVYYLAVLVNGDLQKLFKGTNQVVTIVIQGKYPQNQLLKLKIQAEEKVSACEQQINIIEKYLCNQYEEVISKFFNRKINKVLIKIHEIRQNCLQWTLILKKMGQNKNIHNLSNRQSQKVKQRISYELQLNKVNQIQANFNKKGIKNQTQFRYFCQQIHNIAISINKDIDKQINQSQDYNKLVKNILVLENQFIKCYKSVTPQQQLSHNKHYQKNRQSQTVSLQSAFGIFQLQEQDYPFEPNMTVHQYHQSCENYLKNTNLLHAQQFQDQRNFNTSYLRRLIQLETNYKDINLAQIPQLKNIQITLQPRICEHKIPNIFNPKISTKSYKQLINLFLKLAQRMTKLQLQHSSQFPLSGLVFELLLRRQNIIKLLVKDLTGFQKLVNVLSGLQLNTRQLQVTSQITSNNILNLILINKELDMYLRQVNQNQKFRNTQIDKFMNNLIYLPLQEALKRILKRKKIIFRQNKQQQLQQMWQQVRYYIDFMKISNQNIENYSQLIKKNKQNNLQMDKAKNQFKNRLIELRNQLIKHLQNKNSNLNYGSAQRQLVRLDEMILVCEKGSLAQNIVDQKALTLQKLFVL